MCVWGRGGEGGGGARSGDWRQAGQMAPEHQAHGIGHVGLRSESTGPRPCQASILSRVLV